MVGFQRFRLWVIVSTLALIPAGATTVYARNSAKMAAQKPQREQPAAPSAAQQPDPAQGPDQQAPASPETAAPSQQQQMVMLTGTIVRESNQYVLKGSATYKLDAQNKAKSFEGQKVRVMGTLDTASNMVHVDQIKPAA